MSKKYVLIIHAGCEDIDRKNFTCKSEQACLDTLSQSLTSGQAILEQNGQALDAVEEAIKVLEDSPFFNAGHGSVFNQEGKNEMDAAIMDGQTLKAGAVACVTTIKNPISAARLVMERTRHVLLIGSGAERFVQEQGLEMVDPAYFFTQRRWDEYRRAKNQAHQGQQAAKKINKFGTVGAVSLDRTGNLAAGSSTGGMPNKKQGRVGDSPIIGAGIYANNATCAVSCTGQGECFMRQVAAYQVSSLTELGKLSLQQAGQEVLQKILDLGGQGGLIAVDQAGQVALPFVTKGMYRGLVIEGQPSHIAMYGPFKA